MVSKPTGKPVRAKDATAAKYRARGWTYLRVANEMGYADESGAYRAVQRALVHSYAEPMEEARQLELQELDQLAQEAWEVLERVHYVTNNAGVVHRNGAPLVDDKPTLDAIDRLLNIQARRAKLLGLDAPVKSIHEHITLDAIDAEIKRLEHEMDRVKNREPA